MGKQNEKAPLSKLLSVLVAQGPIVSRRMRGIAKDYTDGNDVV